MHIDDYTPTCHHDVFVNDEGIIPTCDLCDGPQFTEGDDWNGETGNHHSCEERTLSGDEFRFTFD